MSKLKVSSKGFMLDKMLTVDPGWHTGWAYWMNNQVSATGVINSPRGAVTDTLGRMDFMFGEFNALCKVVRPKTVVIEGVARYQNMTGEASIDTGDLFVLCYMIGGYLVISNINGAKAHLVTAPEWKGNMSKEITMKRIELTMNRKFPNHIADAVGMGLSLVGKL